MFQFLSLVNEYHRTGEIDRRDEAKLRLDDLLKPIHMETVLDKEHYCYTIGIVEYICY
jgi:hypothetical protein